MKSAWCLFWAVFLSTQLLTAGEMVLIKGGSFKMGSDSGRDDAKPVHEVTLSPFYMDKYEVSQQDFRDVTGQNPSRFTDLKGPVERIRWVDAVVYCNLRSMKEGLKPCYTPRTWICDFTANGYRLPTEAEWEYACRAGDNDGGGAVSAMAWFRKNSREKTHKGGTRKPNAFGLYDMYGNVAEWCNDFYDEKYYSTSPALDPRGPKTGTKRVLRGGSWADREKKISSSIRAFDDPATADVCQGNDTYGFRCVRKATDK